MSGYGFICVSDVPRELFKKANDGKVYLNIKVVRRKEVGKYGETHFISCEPKEELRKDGINYFCGSLTEWKPKTPQTPEEVDALPGVDENEKLPF